ncbi:MAG: thioredoxin [Caldiserica bacterium]|jgi:thioredoxin 1|nr:thioredoxin [Caldisericota bacterium]MDH7562742.1 thioredoxin [Caldisericota bacterium]
MSKIKEISADEFQKEVLESEIPVLVDFWAPWCAPCRMQAPVLEKIQQELGDKLKIVKVNTDLNPELAAHFQVMSIPNLLFFKGGKLEAQMVGYHSEKELKAKIGF